MRGQSDRSNITAILLMPQSELLLTQLNPCPEGISCEHESNESQSMASALLHIEFLVYFHSFSQEPCSAMQQVFTGTAKKSSGVTIYPRSYPITETSSILTV